MRAVGANARAARFAGIAVNAVVVKTALVSGALAGLAGVGEVAGRAGYLTLDMSPGYGYSGIVIAMLAGLNPLGVVLAALFVAGLIVGADSMSREMHAVPGIPGLTRQLVERHPDVFAAHLPALLEARDREIAEVSAGVWRLEREWVADVAGRSQWEQDNRREAAGSDALAQLGEALQSERALIDALRRSWSWRVTAPLRAVLGWVRR